MSCNLPRISLVRGEGMLIAYRGGMGRVFGCIWTDLWTTSTSTSTKFRGFRIFKANKYTQLRTGLSRDF